MRASTIVLLIILCWLIAAIPYILLTEATPQ